MQMVDKSYWTKLTLLRMWAYMKVLMSNPSLMPCRTQWRTRLLAPHWPTASMELTKDQSVLYLLEESQWLSRLGQGCPVELSTLMKIPVLIASSYMQLLSTWNVTNETEKLSFLFYLISLYLNLNSHMRLAATTLNSIDIDISIITELHWTVPRAQNIGSFTILNFSRDGLVCGQPRISYVPIYLSSANITTKRLGN